MPDALRAIYMAKDKPSAVAALRYLVDVGVDVVAVVAPESSAASSGAGERAEAAGRPAAEPPRPAATRTGLADAARDLDLPLTTDVALYDRLAGDDDAAPGVGSLDDVDLVLSFLFWKRIQRPLIALPRIGCINFHPAPLPDFRGLGGYNVAILEGLREWGVSAHFVDEAFDTGDLIRVDRFPIDADTETARSLERRSQDHLVALFQAVIDMARAGEPLPRTAQGEGRYVDRDEFERMKLVQPDDPPELIERKVRAFWYPPYRGATIELGGQRYTLVSDVLLEDIATRGREGSEGRGS